MLETYVGIEGIVGDSTLIEFLRDLFIVIAGAALVIWLLVMGIIAILIYKKFNAALLAVRNTAHNLQEGGQAFKDSFSGKNPLFGIAAAGLGKAIGAMVRSAFRR